MAAPRSEPLAASTLKCPRDGAMLAPFTIANITVDTCRDCLGTWLDAGELRGVTHDGELEALATAAGEHAPTSFACPRCAGSCVETRVEDVALDTCVSCHGVWVDRDELTEARVRILIARKERPSPLRRLLDTL